MDDIIEAIIDIFSESEIHWGIKLVVFILVVAACIFFFK